MTFGDAVFAVVLVALSAAIVWTNTKRSDWKLFRENLRSEWDAVREKKN